jgi:hypothetical protein
MVRVDSRRVNHVNAAEDKNARLVSEADQDGTDPSPASLVFFRASAMI